MKLYLGKPVHLIAGGSKPGANSGAKSNAVMDAFSLLFPARLGGNARFIACLVRQRQAAKPTLLWLPTRTPGAARCADCHGSLSCSPARLPAARRPNTPTGRFI